MILERNGIMADRGGVIELDDQLDATLLVRITDVHGVSKSIVLTLAEGGHLSHELRLALKRIEEQEQAQ